MNPGARKIVPKPKGLNCPHCGSAIELRAMGAAAAVVCSYCLFTLDATNPQLVILQRFKSQMTVQSLIPLGSRGSLFGAVWEIIGFQQRGIKVEGTSYLWREYVLFNPYKGFRYLSEYDNHWSFVTPLPSIPVPGANDRQRPNITLDGVTYDHFQSARAYTRFVIGEFPWQVKIGETVSTADYVAPPKMLSSETTENEVTWSRGEYVEGKDIWAAFQLPGTAPIAIGIYSNQPIPPRTGSGRPWKLFFVFAALLMGMMIVFSAIARQETVLDRTYTYQPLATGEKSFVTPPFELKGNSANLEVDVTGDGLDNAWAFIGMALINEQTGQAFDFGRQISYYHGVDGGESWTEDNRNDSATLPSIPGGRYYLRLEPETEAPAAGAAVSLVPIKYKVKLVRDVPFYFRYFIGLFLLLLPLPFLGRKGPNLEDLRWKESDYGVNPGSPFWSPGANSGDDDE